MNTILSRSDLVLYFSEPLGLRELDLQSGVVGVGGVLPGLQEGAAQVPALQAQVPKETELGVGPLADLPQAAEQSQAALQPDPVLLEVQLEGRARTLR